MDAAEKDEIRKWAVEKLEAFGLVVELDDKCAPSMEVTQKGTAYLNREILSRLERLGVPDEFIALIAVQLGVLRKGRNEPRLKIAKMAAAMKIAQGDKSVRKLADDLHVSRPAIDLWKEKPEFQKLIAIFELTGDEPR